MCRVNGFLLTASCDRKVTLNRFCYDYNISFLLHPPAFFAAAIRLYDHVMINESGDEVIGVDLKRVGFGVTIDLFAFATTQKNNKSFISKGL